MARDGASAPPRSTATLVYGDPDFAGVLPRRHAGRRDLAAAARLAPGAAQGVAAASRTSARSRGCSRGRRRGSCCRPGTGSAARSRRRVEAARARAAARDGARVAVLRRRCSPTPRWRARRPTSPIGRRYAELVDGRARCATRIWGRIEAEFELTVPRAAARSPARARLLDREPAPAAPRSTAATRTSTRCRSLQVELLRRSRAAGDGDGEELARASFLAINGIAAGCATPAEPRSRSILAVALAPMAELVDAPG